MRRFFLSKLLLGIAAVSGGKGERGRILLLLAGSYLALASLVVTAVVLLSNTPSTPKQTMYVLAQAIVDIPDPPVASTDVTDVSGTTICFSATTYRGKSALRLTTYRSYSLLSVLRGASLSAKGYQYYNQHPGWNVVQQITLPTLPTGVIDVGGLL